MQTKFIIAAAVSALAASASAAPHGTPYALGAVHADFQAQLEEVAGTPGEVGAAAGVAADLMRRHNAAQERLVLPLLGRADAASTGKVLADPDLAERAQQLKTELPQLFEGDVELLGALAELYAVADEDGQPEILRLAERLIWHQTSDVEVLYPAAVLVGSIVPGPRIGAGPIDVQTGPGPLYGLNPVPMMGVGSPHATEARN
jgi:hypothetical protein